MATLSDLLTFSRAIAQTDSNGLTDANGIIFANEALLDFHRSLIDRGVDASQIQESYRDGTTGTGTYLYPVDMFALKTIELNYTDTNANNYAVATQVDAANLPTGDGGPTSFSWLRNNASTSTPYFDDRGDWFEIFPTPTGGNNVTQLIRILYYLAPTPFAATSDTVSYPSSLDYRTMGWRVAANYKRSLLDFDSANEFEKEYQRHLAQMTTTLNRGSEQPLQATPLQLTGWNF